MLVRANAAMRMRGQTVATNRMLVESLVIINGGAATAALAYYGAHNASGQGKSAALLTLILYCLGVFTAIFAGLYVRRTTQEWSSFWELKSSPTWPSGKKSWKDTDSRR
jgi:hypothetical protein